MYTKILEVNLFAFAYRLFHEDFSSIDGTLHGTYSFSIGLTDNTFKTRYNDITDTQAASEMRNIGMQQPSVITYGH